MVAKEESRGRENHGCSGLSWSFKHIDSGNAGAMSCYMVDIGTTRSVANETSVVVPVKVIAHSYPICLCH
jgi:hypothetical protein